MKSLSEELDLYFIKSVTVGKYLRAVVMHGSHADTLVIEKKSSTINTSNCEVSQYFDETKDICINLQYFIYVHMTDSITRSQIYTDKITDQAEILDEAKCKNGSLLYSKSKFIIF